MVGFVSRATMNQSGGEIGYFTAADFSFLLTDGTVGNAGSGVRDARASRFVAQLDGGLVTGVCVGGLFVIDQAAGNTITGTPKIS
jgi:hypothetical protein